MIRTVVVDDHPVFRQGLVHAVEAADDFELVISAASIEALGPASLSDIDVVILDLGLQGMGGAEGVRYLTKLDFSVLVVSANGKEQDVMEAMASGASGYLTKAAEPEEIINAARVVADGGTYVSPTLAGYLLRNSSQSSSTLALTEREREILALVAEGERDSDIAMELNISIKTVHSHLDRIRDKTGRRRRADLTRYAIEQGLMRAGDA